MITIPDAENKKILLAPMAGVTDKPFRQICRRLGAHACVSEMITANTGLYNSRKSQYRMDFTDEPAPRIVQIAGADPRMMAEAARYNVDEGADVIDINMGCPAKKVCNVMAGSSLLRDESLVAQILESVVNAVSVPVSLKIRTGWDSASRNALVIARIAEQAGIQRLTVHGRTRADRFNGRAEHHTTAAIKDAVAIEVIANGDIDSDAEAMRVLHYTAADGVMIGRAACGNPWLFSRLRHRLETGHEPMAPTAREKLELVTLHLEGIYSHYGEQTGVRIARKHIYWYCEQLSGFERLRQQIRHEENCAAQLLYVQEFITGSEVSRLAA